MQISLEGRRAFVTAGGAGMGRATVLAMHRVGATVFTCDIDPAGLDTLPDGITTSVCDVTSSAELDAIFDEILPDGLDFMINNAGVAGPTKLVEDITDDEWRHTMAVCIDAQFYCARRVVPVFKAQRSRRDHQPDLGRRHSWATPRVRRTSRRSGRSTGFTKTLAMELGPDNIRVNGIVPGNVNGDRMERVIAAHAAADGPRTRGRAPDVRDRHVDAVLRRPRRNRRPHRLSVQRLRPPHLGPGHRRRRQHRNAVPPILNDCRRCRRRCS